MSFGPCGTMRRLAVLFLGLSIAMFCGACQSSQIDELFQKRIGREALHCLHPTGQFQSAGALEKTGKDIFQGAIYWKGGFLGNNYVTNVKVQVDEHFVRIYLVEDTAILPAINRNCQLPIDG